MRKKFFICSAAIAVVAIAAVNVNIILKGNKNVSFYAANLHNIEAWAQLREDQQQQPPPKGWLVSHFRCYNSNGVAIDKWTATSSYTEGGRGASSHDHSCSNCSN